MLLCLSVSPALRRSRTSDDMSSGLVGSELKGSFSITCIYAAWHGSSGLVGSKLQWSFSIACVHAAWHGSQGIFCV